jgi:hypothetical protein
LGGKASSRLAIISRSIIDASSTTSTSSGNRLPQRKWREPGRLPSRRCTVLTSVGICARTALSTCKR